MATLSSKKKIPSNQEEQSFLIKKAIIRYMNDEKIIKGV